VVTRNSKGKLTMAFPRGLEGITLPDALAAFELIFKELER